MRSFTIAVMLGMACSAPTSGSGGGGGGSAGGGSGATGGGNHPGGGSGSTGGGTSASGGGSGATGGGTSSGGLPSPVFSVAEPWTKDVSALQPATNSGAVITALKNAGGWGNNNVFQIDFSIIVLQADGSTPRKTVNGPVGGGYCYNGTDCDAVPFQMPIPANGNTEGSADYTCDVANNDCHVLVVETQQRKLYELYNATLSGSAFNALVGVSWNLDMTYPDNERGDGCTSADAAGLPMSGLMVTADEVASGNVPHAIRFILPNPYMKQNVYLHPASHIGSPSSTDPNAPPYGVRFRLKSTFDETPYNAAQKTILHAMKKYGLILSDGGGIALTFADDRLATHKWADLGVDSHAFTAITVDDFEVVDYGAEITNADCVRNP
jgi:serine/threonine-protein kinase